MPATYSIQQWARQALTGDTTSSSPSDGQLGPLILSVKREAKLANPCIGSDPDTALVGDDLEAWTEWIGHLAAERFAKTTAGRALMAAGKTIVKLGPVTKEVQNGGEATTTGDLLWLGNKARAQITCIREAIVAANGQDGGLFRLAGRRRAIGEATQLERAMLGEGRE
jgi:hypothetical protein